MDFSIEVYKQHLTFLTPAEVRRTQRRILRKNNFSANRYKYQFTYPLAVSTDYFTRGE